MKFGLTVQEYQLLSDLVVQPLKKQNAQVWVFGSRARGDQQKFSDIDMLFELPSKSVLPPGYLSKIKEDIEESRFPIKVDLVDKSHLAQSYRANVEREKVAF